MQVNWINSPGVWTWYLSLIVAGWLLTSALTNDPGLAWTYVHLLHGVLTYYLLHWTKGSMSPGDPTDQGLYDRLTVWEQMDNQTYGTGNRKFFTVVPIALFVLAVFMNAGSSVTRPVFARSCAMSSPRSFSEPVMTPHSNV